LRSNAVDRETLRTLPGLFRGGALIALPDAVVVVDEAEPLSRFRSDCLVGPRLGLPVAR
jgi:hypothetical protein